MAQCSSRLRPKSLVSSSHLKVRFILIHDSSESKEFIIRFGLDASSTFTRLTTALVHANYYALCTARSSSSRCAQQNSEL